MESCNGLSGRTALRHVHESKTARVACLAVGHHIDRVYGAIRREELVEVLNGHDARKIANKNVHTKVLLGSMLSRSPEYASSTHEHYRGGTAKAQPGSLEYVLLSRVMRSIVFFYRVRKPVIRAPSVRPRGVHGALLPAALFSLSARPESPRRPGSPRRHRPVSPGASGGARDRNPMWSPRFASGGV